MYALTETHLVCDTTASPFLSCQVYIPSIIHISKRIYFLFFFFFFYIVYIHFGRPGYIIKVAQNRDPGNTGSLYPYHTMIDNLPHYDDGRKLGSNLIKRLMCIKKNINAYIFLINRMR